MIFCGPTTMILRTGPARDDLAEIWLHIALDNLQAADRLIDVIDRTLDKLEANPRLGILRDDLLPSARCAVVGSYLLFYREIAEGLELLRVLHGARNLRRVFRRRKAL